MRNQNSYKYIPEWTANRVNYILEVYGEDFFKGKDILELGSMWGDIGNVFQELGANVTCLEGREDNYLISVQRFPNLNCQLKNIEDIAFDRTYDVIINMGILYHLKSAVNLMEQCSYSCKYMILESEVVDSLEDKTLDLIDSDGYDQAVSDSRLGRRPSTAWIENRLTDFGFKYTRHDSIKLDSGPHIYSWKELNDDSYNVARRRFWTCEKI